MDMHDSDEAGLSNEPETLAAWLRAASPAAWLVDEVVDYLFDGLSPQDRHERGTEFFERLPEERNRFLSNAFAAEDIVLVTVTVRRSNGTSGSVVSSVLPTPAALLEICLKLADIGDVIEVRQMFASGFTHLQRGVWPLGMVWAVDATADKRELVEQIRQQTGNELADPGPPELVAPAAAWVEGLRTLLSRICGAARRWRVGR